MKVLAWASHFGGTHHTFVSVLKSVTVNLEVIFHLLLFQPVVDGKWGIPILLRRPLQFVHKAHVDVFEMCKFQMGIARLHFEPFTLCLFG